MSRRLENLKEYVDSYTSEKSIGEQQIKVLLTYYLELKENTTLDEFLKIDNEAQRVKLYTRFDNWLMSFGFDSLETLSDDFILHKKEGK